jgi:CHAD domain-containing protein
MAHATTVNRTDLSAVLRRQLRALLHHLPRAKRGRTRAVHQARVASRRLREALPVAMQAVTASDRPNVRRDVRKVTVALGRVREMDVALAEFDREASAASTWSGSVVQRVREHLEAERGRREREMKARLAALNVKRLEDRVKALANAIEERPPHSWRRVVSGRLRRRSRRFGEALRAVGTLYAIDTLHALRIAGKKLRYTLELAQQAAGAPVAQDLAALERLQDLLGRIRDLQILQEQVHVVAADAAHDATLTRSLDSLAGDFDAECRDLHARFLRRTPRLAALADRVSRQAAADLAVRRVARMTDVHRAPARRAARPASA